TRLSWDWGDGTFVESGFAATHRYATNGSYTVTVTAFSSTGKIQSSSTTVNITNAEDPLCGSKLIKPEYLTCGNVSVTGCVGTGSCTECSADRFSWDWGDGYVADSWWPASHHYQANGTYTLTVTVYCSTGETQSSSTTVTITNAEDSLCKTGMSMYFDVANNWLILAYTEPNHGNGKFAIYLKVMDTNGNLIPPANIKGLDTNPYLIADDAVNSNVSLAFASNTGMVTVTFTDGAGLALVRISDILQPTYGLSGAVRTSGSVAIPGVTMNLSGQSTGSTTTDGSGNYSFANLINGSYTVTPSKLTCTFSPLNIPVDINGNEITGQDFTGICGYSISGKVTSYKGPATAGVTITLSGAKSATTTTDASGNYRFIGLSSGTYTIKPTKTGFAFSPYSATKTINSANATQNFTSYP
ncbi:MAG TPA: hypothetical protein DCY25_03705, partial [Bacteroidales bacterium]|nr:hypothetical protein [Bacteroidales bacterium]